MVGPAVGALVGVDVGEVVSVHVVTLPTFSKPARHVQLNWFCPRSGRISQNVEARSQLCVPSVQ